VHSKALFLFSVRHCKSVQQLLQSSYVVRCQLSPTTSIRIDTATCDTNALCGRRRRNQFTLLVVGISTHIGQSITGERVTFCWLRLTASGRIVNVTGRVSTVCGGSIINQCTRVLIGLAPRRSVECDALSLLLTASVCIAIATDRASALGGGRRSDKSTLVGGESADRGGYFSGGTDILELTASGLVNRATHPTSAVRSDSTSNNSTHVIRTTADVI
tara:strand:- start:1030 stop:1680 length:651 start_codon:yes stop_codon:yes gene_type:complete